MDETKRVYNKKIIVGIILVIAAGIYWFGLRPYLARTSCSHKAESIATETAYDGSVHRDFEKYEKNYLVCLNRKGF